MSKCVLIVDDDQEFAQLLRGVFERAGHSILIASSAEQGMEQLKKQQVDLLVTDQRMPGGLSGSDFVSRLRQDRPELPIIMVSGYLDDDTIRDLIREGVAGVFIKPLNIISLLKKASDLLEGVEKQKREGSGVDNEIAAGSGGIGGIEGHSEKGRKFLERAREAAGFRRNLMLIGPSGTLYDEVARDIIRLSQKDEQCVSLRPGEISASKLEELISRSEDRPLALILLDAEGLSTQQVEALVEFAEKHGGVQGKVRMVFCLSRSVEELYDHGTIDEEFYLFLGTNELEVPPLREMPEDLVAIAQKILDAETPEPAFDMKLRSFFLSRDWPENMVQLKSVIIRAVSLAQPMPPQVRHLEAALNPDASFAGKGGDERSALERFLNHEKSHYMQAMDILLNG